MERLKKAVHPLHFASVKVSKSTMEFVRFEAEAANRDVLAKLLKALDNSSLKVWISPPQTIHNGNNQAKRVLYATKQN